MDASSSAVRVTDSTDTFEQYRRRLRGIAYRMLGSRADAEDMVQEAWLRWHHTDTTAIRAPEAWLVTAITRLCIDRLRALRVEREAYTGPWLPEPLEIAPAPAADHTAELASDLSVAFLALLERLAPEERAALLLREAFESDYADVARILGKSETACRQLVSRARRRVRDGRPRVAVSPVAQRDLLDRLVKAIQDQDKAALVSLLTSDATWTSDGGGRTKAAKKTIRGAELVARFATGVYRGRLARTAFRPVAVNGQPAIAVVHDGRLFGLLTIRTDGRRIVDIFILLNPDKLRGPMSRDRARTGTTVRCHDAGPPHV